MEAIEGDQKSEKGVEDVVWAELAGRHGELSVNGLSEEQVEFPGANEFGEVGQVDVEDGLEELRDELVCADQGDDVPAGPVADG